MVKKMHIRILNIGLMIFVLSLVSACSEISEQNSSKQDVVYERVMRSGEINIGYISYPPSFIKDPNTNKFSGIFYEVIELAAKNMDFKLKFVEEVGWGTMIESLNNNKVDIVVAGIWPTSTRGKKADFSTPIYYSVVRAYTRYENSTFDSDISRINSENVRIATIDGEMTSIIASSDFPYAKTISLPQTSDVSQVLLEVSSNKADVTFVEPAIAEEYMKNNPGKIKAVAGISPLRVFPNVMMVNKGETKFLSMLNTAITELINNGYVDKIIDKYEKYPNSFERVALPFRQ
jgi:ABC-type amino acid transport substrate-binding protein